MPSTRARTGVYAIVELRTGRSYIGSSVDIHHRWGDHRRLLIQGTHTSRFLQNTWNKYGANAFDFRVLEECARDKQTLLALEQHYIDTFRPAFNTSPTAGSALGVKHVGETLERIRAGARRRSARTTHCPKGHPYTPERTYVTSRNQRVCLECARIASIAKYEHKTPFRSDGPVCQQGHEWTPENTITLKSGTRQCKACKDERRESRNERNRARYESDAEFRERSRLDYERHKAERLAKDKVRREQHKDEIRARRVRLHQQERIAKGLPPEARSSCKKGHPWAPETTVYKGKTRLCKICRDATRATELPEAHAARLARRRELERATYHEANQRAYARRKARALVSV